MYLSQIQLQQFVCFLKKLHVENVVNIDINIFVEWGMGFDGRSPEFFFINFVVSFKQPKWLFTNKESKIECLVLKAMS